jgi:hypothetical protein
MAALEMTEEAPKLLLNVLERYHSHLEVEISHTDTRAFKDALKEREKALNTLIEKVRKLTK